MRLTERKGVGMRHFHPALMTVSLLLGTAAVACAGGPKVVWSKDARACHATAEPFVRGVAKV